MFRNFIGQQSSWLSGQGPESEIVFSSRIRLARNLEEVPFPSRANSAQREKVFKTIKNIYSSLKSLEDCMFVAMDGLDEIDSQLLLERHLVSQECIASSSARGLIMSKDEQIAIMINEEDHLRMQVLMSGLNLKKCWQTLNTIDDELSKIINFSFLPDLGYLTSCLTNLGTGLRASCMLRLPALILTKRINKILELLSRISFTTRGLFGEGTQALGDFFQISNQISLGLSEEELVDNLEGVVYQVKDQEMDARNFLMKKHKVKLEDNVWRALGILRNCRLITSREALSHLSILSLGLDLGIIKDKEFPGQGRPQELINSLFIMIQPAHLQKIETKSLGPKERDFVRAEILRNKLGGDNV